MAGVAAALIPAQRAASLDSDAHTADGVRGGSIFSVCANELMCFFWTFWAAKDVAPCHSISYNRWSSDCIAP